jgi:hypothetical protein
MDQDSELPAATAPPDQTELVPLLVECQRLLDEVTGRLRAAPRARRPTAKALHHTADVIAYVLFARSTRTYEGVVKHLGQRGFAEQGAMLNRSLFEDMVDARWVALNPEIAVERLRQHHRYSQQLRIETARRFPQYFGQAIATQELDPPMDDEERHALTALYGPFATKTWTGLNLHERFRAGKETWKPGDDRQQAEFIYAWLHRDNNETLHASAHSLAVLGAPTVSQDEVRFRLGSTQHLLPGVLWFAYWTYAQTVAQFWLVFELDDWIGLRDGVITPGLARFAS